MNATGRYTETELYLATQELISKTLLALQEQISEVDIDSARRDQVRTLNRVLGLINEAVKVAEEL